MELGQVLGEAFLQTRGRILFRFIYSDYYSAFKRIEVLIHVARWMKLENMMLYKFFSWLFWGEILLLIKVIFIP